jgi:hypothetical protein
MIDRRRPTTGRDEDHCMPRTIAFCSARFATLLATAAMALLAAAAPHAARAQAAAPAACDSTCLRGFVDDYFEALEARDPSKLPVAENVKFTENGRVLTLGEGFWNTAGKPHRYRDYIVDPQTGNAAALSAMTEFDGIVQTFVRLKIVARKITEIETFAVRVGDQRWFNAANLDNLDGTFNAVAPTAGRATREQLIAAADAYFTAVTTEGTPQFVQAPFGTGVKRIENGVQTTMNDKDPVLDRHRLPPEVQLERAYYKGSNVQDRRFPVVDVEHGTVLAVATFRREGPDSSTLLLAEAFKVTDGKIREIRAVILNLPNGAGTGWSTATTR